jgi:hypothetical protein
LNNNNYFSNNNNNTNNAKQLLEQITELAQPNKSKEKETIQRYRTNNNKNNNIK